MHKDEVDILRDCVSGPISMGRNWNCTITMCSWSGGQPAVLVLQRGRTCVSQCLSTYLIAQIICIIVVLKVLKLWMPYPPPPNFRLLHCFDILTQISCIFTLNLDDNYVFLSNSSRLGILYTGILDLSPTNTSNHVVSS